jgi:cytochrome c553
MQRERSMAGRARVSARALLVGLALLALAPVPAAGGDRAAGRTRAEACVQCHGANGISVLPNAPNLAGQPEVYLVEQLRQFRSGRRPSEVMGVIAKPLTDRDIDDLAAWYSAIAVEATPPR